MKQLSVTAPAPGIRLDEAVFKHLWLHVALGAIGSTLLLTGVTIASQRATLATIDWLDVAHVVPALVLMSCAGAAVVGAARVPALRWLGQRAQQQQWPLARLLLASAALFLAPILPVFLFGLGGRYIGLISLCLSLPFFISYVWTVYWLRRRFYALPQPTNV
jgi:hypothetical protein